MTEQYTDNTEDRIQKVESDIKFIKLQIEEIKEIVYIDKKETENEKH